MNDTIVMELLARAVSDATLMDMIDADCQGAPMPQSTPDLIERWGVPPHRAMMQLHANFHERKGVITPKPGYEPTADDYSAIDFLVQEWDFAYEPTVPFIQPKYGFRS